MSRIRSIIKKKITTETLWNLAVEDDESYVANGVVVHNCRSVLIPITRFEDYKVDTKTESGKNIDSFLEKNVTDKGFSVFSLDEKPKKDFPEKYPQITDPNVEFNTEARSNTQYVITYSLKGNVFQITTVDYEDENKKTIKSIQHKRVDDAPNL